MRGGRLGAQSRGVRGDPSFRPRARPPQRRAAVLARTLRFRARSGWDLGVVVETERLLLRRFREDDVDTLARWNADVRFMRHLGRPSLTRAETVRALRRYADHWREHDFGILAAEERETGRLVGRVGVAYHRNWPADPEVGWGFDPDVWGRGLATEAGGACVRWAFEQLGLPRLVSIVVAENAASRRVMDKLGFELHATLCDPVLRLELLVHARELRSRG